MRLDANLANDPTLAALLPDGVTLADILGLFKTVYHINGEQLLSHRLGTTHPANLALPELAEFIKWLLRTLKSGGVRDPADVLARGVQLRAKEATSKLETSAEIGNIVAQAKSGPNRVELENSPAGTSAASPPSSPAAHTIASGTTKADLLSRLKAAIEAGKGRRHIADGLAFAREHFHASQREIGRAIARHPSWVNRMLKWRQSGYKQSSPFGPTTRSGRIDAGTP